MLLRTTILCFLGVHLDLVGDCLQRCWSNRLTWKGMIGLCGGSWSSVRGPEAVSYDNIRSPKMPMRSGQMVAPFGSGCIFKVLATGDRADPF